jgi:hypothetical protein
VIKAEREMNSIQIVNEDNGIYVRARIELEAEFKIAFKSARQEEEIHHPDTHCKFIIANNKNNRKKLSNFKDSSSKAIEIAELSKGAHKPAETRIVISYSNNPENSSAILSESPHHRVASHIQGYSVARIYLPFPIFKFVNDKNGLKNILESLKKECSIELGFIDNETIVKRVSTNPTTYKDKPENLLKQIANKTYGIIDVCDLLNRERTWDYAAVKRGVLNALLKQLEKRPALKNEMINYQDLIDFGVISRADMQKLKPAIRDRIFTVDLGL